jgi:hypothetical protein
LRSHLLFLLLVSSLAACVQQPPAIDESMRRVDAQLPADFAGSWQRNYARDDDVNRALQQAWYDLARATPDRYDTTAGMAAPSQRDADAIVALARLTELITRSDDITIVQNNQEIRVERDDDFSLVCRFENGMSQPVENPGGAEICGWDGEDLVSQLTLADGLTVLHRFTISADGNELRVVTTVTSPTSRVPFTLQRFFRKFERPQSKFHCVETLTMKRVCSTKAEGE